MSCPFLHCSPLEKHSQEELNEKWQFHTGLKCTDTLPSLCLLSILLFKVGRWCFQAGQKSPSAQFPFPLKEPNALPKSSYTPKIRWAGLASEGVKRTNPAYSNGSVQKNVFP